MFFWLLYPFSLLFDLATRFRNHLFDIGHKSSVEFDLSTICVGNLTVGGTGKTPHIEYLARLFIPHYKVATLSRGYGRKTSGFRIATPHSSPQEIGDEPLQIFQKLGKDIMVTVCEDRLLAIPQMLQTDPHLQVVLLDDAYQHRRIRPSFNLLLTDYRRLFYQDTLLPAGRLREHPKGANRAHAIVVTKCPENLQISEKKEITKQIQHFSGADKPVFFSYLTYGKPVPLFNHTHVFTPQLLVVTGIAHPQYFTEHLQKEHEIIQHLDFPDHHGFPLASLQKIVENYNKMGDQVCIVITEKDAVKWEASQHAGILRNLPIWYIPIEVSFGSQQLVFDNFLMNSVQEIIEKNQQ